MAGKAKFDKSVVEGLPAHSQVQVRGDDIRVFFAYAYREDGALKQERDYIGAVVDNKFVGNAYYLRYHPVWEKRPIENWRSEKRKKIAEEKERAEREEKNLRPETGMDDSPEAAPCRSVGTPMLLMSILLANKAVQDCAIALSGKFKDIVGAINVALVLAMTSRAHYLLSKEVGVRKVIGNTMLNSQRISELHARIGADMKLSERFGKLRLKHVGNDSLLVIDGTRVNCEADICVSAVGKNKDGGLSPQINLSIVTNASTSQVVSYRYYSGNTADVSTLSDFRTIFDDAELKKTRATILMDRGYDCTEEFIELDKSGYRFIVGTKTSYKPVKRLLEGERNNELFSPYSLLEKSNIYAIKGTDVITHGKDSMSLNLYLFRDPDRAASEGRKLVKCVEKFRKDLAEGNASLDEPMAKYFRNTKVGTRPQCIRETVDEDSYLKGVSSFVSNINYSTEEVFADYKLRNEAEVNFKSMFKNLFRSTRVHSTPALEGAMFTSFLALTALTDLRGRMQRPITAKKVRKGKDRRIEDYFTTAELLHEFDHIVLDHNASGSPRLIGVTEFDKELAADLGLPGIFDSAAEVEKALSAVGLANYLRDQKVSLKR